MGTTKQDKLTPAQKALKASEYRSRPEVKARIVAYDAKRRANPTTEQRTKWNRQQREAWARLAPQRKAEIALYMRNYTLQRNYGITIDEWETLFEKQGRRCACCSSTDPRSIKGWSTDHLHEKPYTIRGILCHRCNIRIGILGDTHERAVESCKMYLNYLDREEKAAA